MFSITIHREPEQILTKFLKLKSILLSCCQTAQQFKIWRWLLSKQQLNLSQSCQSLWLLVFSLCHLCTSLLQRQSPTSVFGVSCPSLSKLTCDYPLYSPSRENEEDTLEEEKNLPSGTVLIKNCKILAQKQKYRSQEQNTEPGNKPMNI